MIEPVEVAFCLHKINTSLILFSIKPQGFRTKLNDINVRVSIVVDGIRETF